MIIYYINDKYSEAANSAFAIHNINMPELGKPYTIREIYIHNDVYHLRLNEIVNPKVGMIEPGFAYHRFTDIPDNVLEWEKVHEIYKTQIAG